MPIEFDQRIRPISQDEFHEIDYEVMHLAFSVHRSLGRLCDERIYHNELAHQCATRFDTVIVEEPVVVSRRDFRKSYSMDMLINYSALYELKAAAAIHAEHKKQALQYLALTELHHGKIVNFRPQSVEHEFVSTRLTKEKRFRYQVDDEAWREVRQESTWLKALICELLAEWGAFLDTQLFYDAVYHFHGGEANVVKRISLTRNGRTLGTQRTHLIDDHNAFKISAVTHDLQTYEKHLRRFLAHTDLHTIQWINFNHHNILFKTLFREE